MCRKLHTHSFLVITANSHPPGSVSPIAICATSHDVHGRWGGLFANCIGSVSGALFWDALSINTPVANQFRKSPNAMPVCTISSAMLATLTAEFVAFYVSSNKIRANDIPSLMENVYRALQKIAGDSEEKVEPSTRTQSSATSGGRRARADLLSDTPVCATNGTVWPSTIARHNRLRRKLGRRRRR